MYFVSVFIYPDVPVTCFVWQTEKKISEKHPVFKVKSSDSKNVQIVGKHISKIYAQQGLQLLADIMLL